MGWNLTWQKQPFKSYKRLLQQHAPHVMILAIEGAWKRSNGVRGDGAFKRQRSNRGNMISLVIIPSCGLERRIGGIDRRRTSASLRSGSMWDQRPMNFRVVSFNVQNTHRGRETQMSQAPNDAAGCASTPGNYFPSWIPERRTTALLTTTSSRTIAHSATEWE
jgi:hypothetical protein